MQTQHCTKDWGAFPSNDPCTAASSCFSVFKGGKCSPKLGLGWFSELTWGQAWAESTPCGQGKSRVMVEPGGEDRGSVCALESSIPASVNHPQAGEVLWRLHRPSAHYVNRCFLVQTVLLRYVWHIQLSERDIHPPTDQDEEREMGVASATLLARDGGLKWVPLFDGAPSTSSALRRDLGRAGRTPTDHRCGRSLGLDTVLGTSCLQQHSRGSSNGLELIVLLGGLFLLNYLFQIPGNRLSQDSFTWNIYNLLGNLIAFGKMISLLRRCCMVFKQIFMALKKDCKPAPNG